MKKKKIKVEEYFIQNGDLFYTGEHIGSIPCFSDNIEKALQFPNIWRAIKTIKSWNEDQQKGCRIYVRTKE